MTKKKKTKRKAKQPNIPAKRIKIGFKAKNVTAGYSVPKYIFDDSRTETEIFSRMDIVTYSWFCNLAPAAVKKQGTSLQRSQSLWKPNDLGIIRLKATVREVLIKTGLYDFEDIKKLTTREILELTTEQLKRQRNKAHKIYQKQWKQDLHEAYELGLEHKSHWEKRIREAVISVIQWSRKRCRGREIPLRAPLPYMQDNYRPPDAEDLPWMYWVLGLKIENVFGIDNVFVPCEDETEMIELYRYIHELIWAYIAKGSVEDFKAIWAQVKLDLLKESPQAGNDVTQIIKPLNPHNFHKCKNYDRLLELHNKRETEGNNETLKRLKEYLKRDKHKRGDIAKTLFLEDGLIKTSLPIGSIFEKK